MVFLNESFFKKKTKQVVHYFRTKLNICPQFHTDQSIQLILDNKSFDFIIKHKDECTTRTTENV